MPAQQVSQGHGVVVLAAYRPHPELFAIQLRSIREQTRSDFRCLIGADGGQDDVRALVAETVGDDHRFEVIGWDDNLGFYLNFERLLMAVPADVAWVALSDQDDRWYPDKLERLVPLLDGATLATGQARVISWPDEHEVLECTNRRVVPAGDLLFENQVTGALSVFRSSLLALALPFPRLHTVTQLHDHWLALCSVTRGSYTVLDEVVQDYVQHAGNIVGEVATHRQWTPLGFARRIIELGDVYEGGHSIVQCARACQVQSFGWRRVVLQALADRSPRLPEELLIPLARLSPRSGPVDMVRLLRSPTVSRDSTLWVVATFVPGIPYEMVWRRRHQQA